MRTALVAAVLLVGGCYLLNIEHPIPGCWCIAGAILVALFTI